MRTTSKKRVLSYEAKVRRHDRPTKPSAKVLQLPAGTDSSDGSFDSDDISTSENEQLELPKLTMKEIEAKVTNGDLILVEPDKSFTADVWKKFKIVEYVNVDGASSRSGYSVYRWHNGIKNLGSSQITRFLSKSKPAQALKRQMTEACLRCCVLDNRPFELVSGTGFETIVATALRIGETHPQV
ncbi:hypothetical protein ROZALSC1DRAFT_31722 [Rozella allomycis CSF55]|uniref:Uncharacterized protein n=1 Tax=Rozella allomycis (strain CSF55) TaxID=988480 RepID=A0A4P9YBR0_ROZAC|nr:hypothetical protein ROZALSC1DRAFT_31722 [Rozella allomycis CSF55]